MLYRYRVWSGPYFNKPYNDLVQEFDSFPHLSELFYLAKDVDRIIYINDNSHSIFIHLTKEEATFILLKYQTKLKIEFVYIAPFTPKQK
jgi:hypothetical protein